MAIIFPEFLRRNNRNNVEDVLINSQFATTTISSARMRVPKMVRNGIHFLRGGLGLGKPHFLQALPKFPRYAIPQSGQNLPLQTRSKEQTPRHRTPKTDKSYLAPNRRAYIRCTHTPHEIRTLFSLITLEHRI